MSTQHANRVAGWAIAPVGTLSAADGQGPPAWRLDAACQYFPTELFFPIGHGPRAQAQANQAKTICKECPVRAECLEYALVTNAQFGVFGGMAEDERRRARRAFLRQVRMGSEALEASA